MKKLHKFSNTEKVPDRKVRRYSNLKKEELFQSEKGKIRKWKNTSIKDSFFAYIQRQEKAL
jgi:hypothetical protein